jgi:hypothetical protein
LVKYQRYIEYLIIILIITGFSQLITDHILINFKLFCVRNYDDILINLFVVHATLIILPLSLFGIFTETVNEEYLGQRVSTYMYEIKGIYSAELFVFNYKEVVAISMSLIIGSYIVMAKELLAAELILLSINLIIIIRSMIFWINARIYKENTIKHIKYKMEEKMVYSIINEYQGNSFHSIISDVLPNLNRWVSEGGEYELNEVKKFHENIYLNVGGTNNAMISICKRNNVELNKGFWLRYFKNIDDYFDQLVVELLRKDRFFSALELSHCILSLSLIYRIPCWYHLNHNYYKVLCLKFKQIDYEKYLLLGDKWIIEYMTKSMLNGYKTLEHLKQEKISYDEYEYYDLLLTIKENNDYAVEVYLSIWENNFISQSEKEQLIVNLIANNSVLDYEKDAIIRFSLELIKKDIPVLSCIIIKHILSGYSTIYNKSVRNETVILAYCYCLHSSGFLKNNTIDEIKELIREKLIFNDKWYIAISNNIWRDFDSISYLLNEYYPGTDVYNSTWKKDNIETIVFLALINNNLNLSDLNKSQVNVIYSAIGEIVDNMEALDSLIMRFKEFLEIISYSQHFDDKSIETTFADFKLSMLNYIVKGIKEKLIVPDKFEYTIKINQFIEKHLFMNSRINKIFISELNTVDTENYYVEFTHMYHSAVNLLNNRVFDSVISDSIYDVILKWYNHNKSFTGAFSLNKSEFLKEFDNFFDTMGNVFQNKDGMITSYNLTFEDIQEDDISNYVKQSDRSTDVPIYINDNEYFLYNVSFRTYDEASTYIKENYLKIKCRIGLLINNLEPICDC